MDDWNEELRRERRAWLDECRRLQAERKRARGWHDPAPILRTPEEEDREIRRAALWVGAVWLLGFAVLAWVASL